MGTGQLTTSRGQGQDVAPRGLTLDRTDRISYPLHHGSILLMDRATQLAWEHAVPRAPNTGPRISLTFRRFASSTPTQSGMDSTSHA